MCVFFGVKITPLKMKECCPRKEPFHKERMVFQAALFGGELLEYIGGCQTLFYSGQIVYDFFNEGNHRPRRPRL